MGQKLLFAVTVQSIGRNYKLLIARELLPGNLEK
jgi:hypothetical protein